MIAAFLIGLIGSWHCVVMCGPIALAVPLDRRNLLSQALGLVLYHGGRLIGYASMGLIVGKVGHLLHLAEWQREVALISGILLFIYAVGFALNSRFRLHTLPAPIGRLRSLILTQFKRTSPEAQLSIGLANAFLPCGLVFGAAALAINASSMLEGMSVMIAFGAGTLPALLLLRFAGSRIQSRFQLFRLRPVVLLTIASLLTLRGLELDLPLLSPSLNPVQGFLKACLPG